MKKIVTLSIFNAFLLLTQAQSNNDLLGTWINLELSDSLKSQSTTNDLESLTPRFIYIDSSQHLTIESRFEQYSEPGRIESMHKEGTSLVFTAANKKFIFANGRLKMADGGKTKYFEKISASAKGKNGMQIYFRNFFWDNHERWQLVSVRSGKIVDSQVILLGARFIRSEKDNKIIHEYEFTDLHRYRVNNGLLYGIVFFKTINNISNSQEIYAIRKESSGVSLYRGNAIAYILKPI